MARFDLNKENPNKNTLNVLVEGFPILGSLSRLSMARGGKLQQYSPLAQYVFQYFPATVDRLDLIQSDDGTVSISLPNIAKDSGADFQKLFNIMKAMKDRGITMVDERALRANERIVQPFNVNAQGVTLLQRAVHKALFELPIVPISGKPGQMQTVAQKARSDGGDILFLGAQHRDLGRRNSDPLKDEMIMQPAPVGSNMAPQPVFAKPVDVHIAFLGACGGCEASALQTAIGMKRGISASLLQEIWTAQARYDAVKNDRNHPKRAQLLQDLTNINGSTAGQLVRADFDEVAVLALAA